MDLRSIGIQKLLVTSIVMLCWTVISSCEADHAEISVCALIGGLEINDQKGRIYKWVHSDPPFFYIGNEQLVTTGVNGGLIPCTELPSEFKQEGLLVNYSGIDKGTRSDSSDPLFGYIDIKKIEKQ